MNYEDNTKKRAKRDIILAILILIIFSLIYFIKTVFFS